MKIAKRIGLPVPEVELRKIEDITFLLVERYDRKVNDKHIERIHQEDFCQALGVPSFKKYQNEGGPGFKDCFELLRTTTQPALDRNLLASAMVFNYLLGNMDAHGKNFSLLHKEPSIIRLAPFYDIVCTRVYDHLTKKMAMKIGREYFADQISSKHWKQLSDDIQYRYLALKKLIETMGEQIKKAARQEKELLNTYGNNHPIIDKIIEMLNRNIDHTMQN